MPTLRQLFQGTQKLHPNAIKWAPDGKNKPLITLEVQKFKGVNSLIVRTTQKSSGRWGEGGGSRPVSRNGIYKQTMRFSLGKLSEGRNISKDKPRVSKDKCNVNCQCDNYYFMWWYGNKKVKAHEGANYKAYKKVPGSNREPVNPQGIPGICKHIVYVTKELKRKKIIQ